MKSVEYINGHMKGQIFLANEEDTETYAIYYHAWCGKQESITYTIIEDIAIVNILEYKDYFCENCRQIMQYRMRVTSSDPI